MNENQPSAISLQLSAKPTLSLLTADSSIHRSAFIVLRCLSEVFLDNRTPRRQIIAEDVFIVLSILALWPTILGWDHVIYEIIKYAALAGLVLIFIRRLKRYQDRR